MSNHINTALLEDAQFHMDYWTGTLWERLIQHAVDTNDLEELDRLLKESWEEINGRLEWRSEWESTDVY